MMPERESALLIFEKHIFSQSIFSLLATISDIFEEDVKELWRRFLADSEGIALACFGSMGRRTMTPFSDIDIVLLVESKKIEQKYEKPLSDFIVSLWDKGFKKIEHSVRTPHDTIKISTENARVLSYLNDLRFLAGDLRVFEKLMYLKRKMWREQKERIFDILCQDRFVRLAKFTNHLEPNLKNSAGGINDFLYQRYIRKLIPGDAIVKTSDSRKSYGNLLEIRSILHYVMRKSEDTLNSWTLEEVAKFIEKKRNRREDRNKLLTHVLEQMHRIKVLTDILQEQVESKLKHTHQEKSANLGDKFYTDGRFLYLNERHELNNQTVMELFKLSKENNLRIPPEFSYRVFKNRKLIKGCHLDQSSLKMAHEILSNLGGIGRTLSQMRDLGVLHYLIPELLRVRNLPQINPPHIYPVDVHLVKSVEEMEKILLGIKPQYVSFLPEISPDKRIVAILAALLHDIGKGRKRDHSRVGEKIAERIGRRFGVVGENLELLKFAVRNHLMLPHCAQRRDLHEIKYLRKVAKLFPDSVSLDLMYVLSISDSIATNPQNWNSWKAHLISEIYMRLSEHLRKGLEYAEEEHIDISLLKEDLQKFFPPELVSRVISSLSQKFLSFFNYDRLFRYMLFLLRSFSMQSRYAAFTKREEGVIEIITIGDDSEGFLCECAGMLFTAGFNILSLYAEGGVLGKAINVFWVEPPNVENFRKFEKIFHSRRLSDLIDEIHEKKKKLIPYYMATNPFANQNTEKTIKVIFDNDSSDEYTIIEVYCFDRPALLFDITYAITFSGYDISVAKISTRENKVADVFYIRDKRKQTGKLSPEQLREIEGKIISAILQGTPPPQRSP